MKKIILTGLMLWISLWPTLSAQTTSLPFSLSIEETTWPSWPGWHSGGVGVWDHYWVLVAGRRNGLHGFFPFTGFPEATGNKQAWVLDPATGQQWSHNWDGVPTQAREVLESSNVQARQRGRYLYITGGYGKRAATDDFVTFPILVAIDLEQLIPLVQQGLSPAPAIRWLEDTRLQVCGGELHLLDDWFYLVGGHNFGGLYSENSSQTFTQTYTNEIRRFKLNDTGTGLIITDYEAFWDEDYHRRDLSVAPLVLPGGQHALAAYGGVFRPNADVPYFNPIFITPDNIWVDEAFEQKMSQYTCPVLPLYDTETQAMHSVFFAGLSFNTYNYDIQQFEVDSLVPFIRQITVQTRLANTSISEQVLEVSFDDLLGTNAQLILAEDSPLAAEGVINLRDLTKATTVGYMYGGIEATIPNITPSSASNRLFRITITPNFVTEASVVTNGQAAPLRVFPNPGTGPVTLEWLRETEIEEMIITDLLGRVWWQHRSSDRHLITQKATEAINQLPAGSYRLLAIGRGVQAVLPLVRMP